MAHALYRYDGKCKNLHGHTYHLEVMLEGIPLQKTGDPFDGMIMDFGEIKSCVHKHILDVFDHAVVLHHSTDYARNSSFLHQFEKVVLLPFQPTCENLTLHFADLLAGQFHDNAQLYSIRLDETPNSFSIWQNPLL